MTGNLPTLSLGDIEAKTKQYALSRDLLVARVRQLQDDIEAAKRRAEPLVKSALATTKAAEAELREAIKANPQHFARPKTHIFHGIKIGFAKGKGKITIEDAELTISLIREYFDKKRAALLIKVKESLRRKALSDLPAADLKRIGVQVEDAGNQVVIAGMDSEIEKALKVLLQADNASAEGEEEDE